MIKPSMRKDFFRIGKALAYLQPSSRSESLRIHGLTEEEGEELIGAYVACSNIDDDTLSYEQARALSTGESPDDRRRIWRACERRGRVKPQDILDVIREREESRRLHVWTNALVVPSEQDGEQNG